jgi:predicted GTPase
VCGVAEKVPGQSRFRSVQRAPAVPALRHAGAAAPGALPLLRDDPDLVTRDYGYWVENQLGERFGLEGVPVSIDFVRRA